MTEEINGQIREFILAHFPIANQQQSLPDEESLLDNNIIDSMGILELVEFIETKFEITVDDEELVPQNFQSIADLSNFVRTKINSP